MDLTIVSEPNRCGFFKKLVNKHCKDWLKSVGKTPEWLRARLIQEMDYYVLQKDETVQALQHKKGSYQGKTFSLLVSYDDVGPQAVHIDMVYPSYQGCMLLTPGPVTDVFPVQNILDIPLDGDGNARRDAEVFAKLMGLWIQRSPDCFESTLVEAILSAEANEDVDVPQFVRDYGSVMAPWPVMLRANESLPFSLASQARREDVLGYVGFVGSVVHRAPSAKGLRVVFFSSYTPPSAKKYDPDSQFTQLGFMAYLFAY